MPRRATLIVTAVALLTMACAVLARRWLDVAEVRGRSMHPTYGPGDRLLLERWSYRSRAPRVGEIVVARDPGRPSRELVKRVAAVADEGVTLRGDAAGSTDSRAFGALPRSAVQWRVAARYRTARPRRGASGGGASLP